MAASTTDIRITRLPPERWQDYKSLRLEMLAQHPEAFATSYEEAASSSQETWMERIHSGLFAINSTDQAVGMLSLVRRKQLKTAHVVDLFQMYVQTSVRRQGIGSKLIAGALAELATWDSVSKVVLGVMETQVAAQKLYEKHGFRVVGTLRGEIRLDGRDYDETLMERFIYQ